MNKDVLTVLGCSGSLAVMLVTVNPANSTELTLQSTNLGEQITAQTGVALSNQAHSPYLSLNYSNRQSKPDIFTPGCKCASCQQITRETIL